MKNKAFLVFYTHCNEEPRKIQLKCPVCDSESFDDDIYELTLRVDGSASYHIVEHGGYAIKCDECQHLLSFVNGVAKIEFERE